MAYATIIESGVYSFVIGKDFAAGAAVVGAGAGVGITFGVSAAKKAPKAKKPEGTEE